MVPGLSSEPDPMFTPDLVQETRTLLGIVLVGTFEKSAKNDPLGSTAFRVW